MKYKHLFFDLDHTLWDFDANAKETLLELYDIFALKDKGIVPFEDFYKLYKIHNDVLWDRYHKGFVTGEELKWRRMYRTLMDFKIADEQLAKQMGEQFLTILPTKKILFPHTVEILDYLTEKKYGLHLITNGFENVQWTKLMNSGLNKYFAHVVTSEKSNSLKPKKEIFEYALNIAGAQLHQSIMLGDNLDADIQGAINVGMDNIFVNHINATTTLQPTYTISQLSELAIIF
jgi:putative hydrolase of the HAD superfamily